MAGERAVGERVSEAEAEAEAASGQTRRGQESVLTLGTNINAVTTPIELK